MFWSPIVFVCLMQSLNRGASQAQLIDINVVFPGVHPSPGAEVAWWCQEEEEEVLHHSQEEQAQEEEGQACCAEVLQGMVLI